MEIQERILDTAFMLFRQYGTRSITMDDIAMRMGISKKTLYAHFEDKDDLVFHAITRYLDVMKEQCEDGRAQSKDALEEMFLVMKMLDDKLRNMNPVALLDLQKFHAKAYQKFEEHKDVFLVDTIKKNLVRGITEGFYREDIDIEIMAHFRTASCLMCFRPDILNLQGYDMGRVQRVLLEHFLFGLATQKGYKQIEKYKQKLP
ncbi:TetR family transcriptional regulator [Chitinophaga skermanii]|uniref:TetR family transcriptional regulator n=1 Tax=Chitinophaga skermanii TaxID=331697 RepID=A0A327R4C7_9BACT|nr:TetR/AcrR family transcriptional regulator [Chitinophaga skermanii]RAJ10583.1 TetR family transcriptional regulator [Chitinophaga skermanii]